MVLARQSNFFMVTVVRFLSSRIIRIVIVRIEDKNYKIIIDE